MPSGSLEAEPLNVDRLVERHGGRGDAEAGAGRLVGAGGVERDAVRRQRLDRPCRRRCCRSPARCGRRTRRRAPGPLHRARWRTRSAPLGAVYLTALTVPGLAGGRRGRAGAALVLQPARVARRHVGVAQPLDAARLAREVLRLRRDRVPLPADDAGPDVGRRVGREPGPPPDAVAGVLAVGVGGGHRQRVVEAVVVAEVHDAEEQVLRHVGADTAADRRVRGRRPGRRCRGRWWWSSRDGRRRSAPCRRRRARRPRCPSMPSGPQSLCVIRPLPPVPSPCTVL